MNNGIKIALFLMGVAVASTSFSATPLSDAMEALAKSEKAFDKAKNQEDAQKALIEMQKAIETMKVNKPKKLLKENVAPEKVQHYEQLVAELEHSIQHAQHLLVEGNLVEAQEMTEKFDELKKQGHRAFRF
jgi:soluble cytochrome b562